MSDFPHPTNEVPNPVMFTCPNVDGGTARVYWNGMVDAINGFLYDVSPGFQSLEELARWTREELTRHAAELRAELDAMRAHPYASPCGEADSVSDRLDAVRSALVYIGRDTSGRYDVSARVADGGRN